MLNPEPAPADPARLFAALGDPTRLSILTRLADGEPRSIAGLSVNTRLTRQAVTKHLHVLEGAGLVASTRSGRESRYAYQPDQVRQACAYLDHVSARWDAALGRLKTLLEG